MRALFKRMWDAFLVEGGFNASGTLVTKTMLGVFGCVPAREGYFRIGFRKVTHVKPSLKAIAEFYEDNPNAIEAAHERVFTLDFTTGLPAGRHYPKANIIDMVLFQEGYGGN